LPLRMLQASATAAAEQPCASPNTCKAWDHAADWLRGRPAANRPSPACHVAHTMAAGHVQCRGRRDCKGPDWSRSDRLVESGTVFSMSPTLKLDNAPRRGIFPATCRSSKALTTWEKIGNPVWPMQQIEIEVISPEASEARLTGPPRWPFSRHMARPHLRDQETRDCADPPITRPMNSSEAVYFWPCRLASIPSERPGCAALSSFFKLPDVFPFQDLPSPGRAPGRWCRRET